MKRILLLGPPRSGSTWVSEVLSAAPGAHRLHEPDSDPNEPFALSAKAGLGRFPHLRERAGGPVERYRRLWHAAFEPGQASSGERIGQVVARAALRSTDLDIRDEILRDTPSPKSLRSRATLRALELTASPPRPAAADVSIVKSVHSPAAAGFVARLTDAAVVVIRRNPLNAVASWLELGWRPQRLAGNVREERELGDLVGAPPPADGAPLVEQHAWSYAALTRVLDIEAARHPEWIVVQHEDLCTDPQREFARLFAQLGLTMSSDVSRTISQHDAPASGYATNRVATEQPERWRERLDADQVDVIRRVASTMSVDC